MTSHTHTHTHTQRERERERDTHRHRLSVVGSIDRDEESDGYDSGVEHDESEVVRDERWKEVPLRTFVQPTSMQCACTQPRHQSSPLAQQRVLYTLHKYMQVSALRIEYKMHDVAANERPRWRHVMHLMTCPHLIGAFIFNSKGRGPVARPSFVLIHLIY